MIIKSMSRKEPSFGQLIAYMADIDKSDTQYNIYHNLYGRHAEDIEKAYQANAKLVPKRKNGVYLYHEILSITKSDQLSAQDQKAKLREIAYEYARRRAPNNLIFATLHDDHDHHLHYHFIISSNPLGETRKTRLSRQQFAKFKQDLEQRVLAHYPELAQTVVMSKQLTPVSDQDGRKDKRAGKDQTHSQNHSGSNNEEKLSAKGGEQKRRTGSTPQRDALKAQLNALFSTVSTKADFFTALSELDIELYVRGKTIGVIDKAHNRKHRLKTLGVMDTFQAMSKRIDMDEALKQTKAESQKNREQASQEQQEKKTRTETDKAKMQTDVSGKMTPEAAPQSQHETTPSQASESAGEKETSEQKASSQPLMEEQVRQRQAEMQQRRANSSAQARHADQSQPNEQSTESGQSRSDS